MNPIEIIEKYYKQDIRLYRILIEHGEHVAQKAIDAARKAVHLNPDVDFIQKAAMLHDIGIFLTNTPGLGCNGKYPYICHGYLGGEILEQNGMAKHALVCERHLGVGITAEDIKTHNLPLPIRDMAPVSVEEQIICFADKFYSKDYNRITRENSVEDIVHNLEQYGHSVVMRFQSWCKIFA